MRCMYVCVCVFRHTHVQVNVLESLRKGLFYIDKTTASVRQPDGGHPELMNVADSALHHKGMTVTSTGFVLPHGTEHPQAPSNTHEYGHMECGDGNDDMATMGAPVLAGSPNDPSHSHHPLPLCTLLSLRAFILTSMQPASSPLFSVYLFCFVSFSLSAALFVCSMCTTAC
jgi:hypothetical protein